MKIIEINKQPSLKEAAEVLCQFENDLIDDKIAGFFIAAIGPDDSVYAYIGTTKPVSRLRLGGAMQHALHIFNHGDET